MTDSELHASLPGDDLNRALTHVRADSPDVPHVGLVGDTYTILLNGKDTAGAFTLIDMHIPPGGGPGPHRHDFEEAFTLLEGEIEAVFRGQKMTVRAGETINIPANAPHMFTNKGPATVRMLCICAPAGYDEFLRERGAPVSSRTEAPPELDEAARKAFMQKARALTPRFKAELLKHP